MTTDIRPEEAADSELVRMCWEKVPGAWEEFLHRFAKLIYYSIHRTLYSKHYQASPDEIDDLFSEALVHFIKDDCRKLRLYRGDEGCTMATWIRTVTVRYVLDYLRQRARTGSTVLIDDEVISLEVSLSNPTPRPDEEYEEREDMEKLLSAVSSLCDNDRYFMELYYVRGLTPEQVGKLLKVSVKTVYSRVNRLKSKIISEMEKDARK